MPRSPVETRRANTQEEIQPLLELCKAGKLFEVQEWIAAGNVVNPPIYANHRVRHHSPLETAVERGFHSLVKVLLEGGAAIEATGYDGPVEKALNMRRLDLIQLFVKHGYDVKSTSMASVFDSWDPDIMEFFTENGADVETGNPMAYALCSRIRTALRIFKKHKARYPSFQEQANIALRYHCKEGNLKWVSIMLWAGADPYAPGTDDYTETLDNPEEDGLSALGYAALRDHFDIFRLKKVRLDPAHPVAQEVMRRIDCEEGFDVLHGLLQKGMNPNDQETGGCSAISRLVNGTGFDLFLHNWRCHRDRKGAGDCQQCREKIKLIHVLAKHGAKWVPKDTSEINEARRSLLKLIPDYTVEFVWIMAKYQACSRSVIEQLLRTPSIKKHVGQFRERLVELTGELQSGT